MSTIYPPGKTYVSDGFVLNNGLTTLISYPPNTLTTLYPYEIKVLIIYCYFSVTSLSNASVEWYETQKWIENTSQLLVTNVS